MIYFSASTAMLNFFVRGLVECRQSLLVQAGSFWSAAIMAISLECRQNLVFGLSIAKHMKSSPPNFAEHLLLLITRSK